MFRCWLSYFNLLFLLFILLSLVSSFLILLFYLLFLFCSLLFRLLLFSCSLGLSSFFLLFLFKSLFLLLLSCFLLLSSFLFLFLNSFLFIFRWFLDLSLFFVFIRSAGDLGCIRFARDIRLCCRLVWHNSCRFGRQWSLSSDLGRFKFNLCRRLIRILGNLRRRLGHCWCSRTRLLSFLRLSLIV